MTTTARGRVLIAEDEPPIVTSLEFLLKSRRIDTRAAGDGETALALAEAFKPHVVLLDVMLPKVSGFEVCRVIRAKKKGWQPRIIFLTARGLEADIARGREIGADLHIGKPFSTKDLMTDIERLLREVSPDWTPIT